MLEAELIPFALETKVYLTILRRLLNTKLMCMLAVIIWDDVQRKAQYSIEFMTRVLNVEVTRSRFVVDHPSWDSIVDDIVDRIVVVLKNHVYVYAWTPLSAPELIESMIFDTADNDGGLLKFLMHY